MEKFLKKFERVIVIGLLGLMVFVILLGTAELVVILFEQLLMPPRFLLDINEMLTVFGFFLMILIGLELIETIKMYLSDESIHVEIIFLVAIIAMTRKVIILDVKSLEPLALVGIAAIIIALSVGYYLLKKTMTDQT
jgi:uncharacterized membrane protein (DUF373 family)